MPRGGLELLGPSSVCACTPRGRCTRRAPAYYDASAGGDDAGGRRRLSSCEYEKYFLCDTVHRLARASAHRARSTTSSTIATTLAAAGSVRPMDWTRRKRGRFAGRRAERRDGGRAERT
ncbi:MAG: hypothetical protein ACLTMP_14505 [Eggerthella lenta]